MCRSLLLLTQLSGKLSPFMHSTCYRNKRWMRFNSLNAVLYGEKERIISIRLIFSQGIWHFFKCKNVSMWYYRACQHSSLSSNLCVSNRKGIITAFMCELFFKHNLSIWMLLSSVIIWCNLSENMVPKYLIIHELDFAYSVLKILINIWPIKLR